MKTSTKSRTARQHLRSSSHGKTCPVNRKRSRHCRLLRRLVLAFDAHTCRLCGVYVGLSGLVDYILPREYGGRKQLDNLLTLCPTCHKRRMEIIAGN